MYCHCLSVAFVACSRSITAGQPISEEEKQNAVNNSAAQATASDPSLIPWGMPISELEGEGSIMSRNAWTAR